MKYKKINDATVQCIITQEDMMEYGLTLTDIFERNEKGEEFLRDVIERAHDEVGYQINNGNIAMQITPLKDKGLVVTFTDESPAAFKDILQHLKEVLQDVSAELDHQEETERRAVPVDLSGSMYDDNMYDENYRMFAFTSIRQVMRYAASIPGSCSVKSHLFKGGGKYYLVMEKNRLSYKMFNRISAQGIEFGEPTTCTADIVSIVEEHGECLIRDRAVSRLRRIYLA